eukprot:TRINITY_DN2543_c0_g1_i1.p1 TRINITY_DN2543_c0_g1~~TRINITY_DN2543_c0_g1_i1.p1  ORF type:complete len:192 (+),score=62.36 TRINITY_DN2543_c0_g1_i1:109-684(+)
MNNINTNTHNRHHTSSVGSESTYPSSSSSTSPSPLSSSPLSTPPPPKRRKLSLNETNTMEQVIIYAGPFEEDEFCRFQVGVHLADVCKKLSLEGDVQLHQRGAGPIAPSTIPDTGLAAGEYSLLITGLQRYNLIQRKWKSKEAKPKRLPPTPVNGPVVLDEFHNRNGQFSSRVPLPDLVSILVDVWEMEEL